MNVSQLFLWNMWYLLSVSYLSGSNDCYLWTTDDSKSNQEKANAITIETTAYALLTAVALKDSEWADKTACWLTTQENYMGGYRSSQVTEVLDWELPKPPKKSLSLDIL